VLLPISAHQGPGQEALKVGYKGRGRYGSGPLKSASRSGSRPGAGPKTFKRLTCRSTQLNIQVTMNSLSIYALARELSALLKGAEVRRISWIPSALSISFEGGGLDYLHVIYHQGTIDIVPS